jgi:Ca2+:H+ antiporter
VDDDHVEYKNSQVLSDAWQDDATDAPRLTRERQADLVGELRNLEEGMAGTRVEQIPLYTIILPAIGIALCIAIGKVGIGLMAPALAAVLLGNVAVSVHHAEVVAIKVGEPFGTLILALSVTIIEVGLIVAIMLSGSPNPQVMRDSIHAVIMLVLHGVAGLCILVCAVRQREAEFRVEGVNAFLGVLIPMSILVLVLPNYVVSAPGPFYTPVQLAFVSAACLVLYGAFLFIQTGWHRAYFTPVGENETADAMPSIQITLTSLGLLPVALLSVVLLAKKLTPALETAVRTMGAPVAVVGIVVAIIVLLPETIAAVRAAARNRLQSSLNLALGSGVASIGLTVPTVAIVSMWIGTPLTLGISATSTVLMALGFLVAVVTYGTGKTNLAAGVIHLVLLATYLVTIFAP